MVVLNRGSLKTYALEFNLHAADSRFFEPPGFEAPVTSGNGNDRLKGSPIRGVFAILSFPEIQG